MDPIRDVVNPFVSLAFKLEVIICFFSFIFTINLLLINFL